MDDDEDTVIDLASRRHGGATDDADIAVELQREYGSASVLFVNGGGHWTEVPLPEMIADDE